MKSRFAALATACLLLAGGVDCQAVAGDRDPWYTDSAEPTPQQSEVQRERILPVPAGSVDSAVTMLRSKPAVPITMQQAQALLGVNSLDPDSLLEQAARDADAAAEKREKESQVPFFAGETAARMKELALEHRQTAAKARSLKGNLKPYLVRGLVLNEGTGQFSAYFRDSTLWVFHGCLGKHEVPMKRRPLIVFLERGPTKVFVTVSMAE